MKFKIEIKNRWTAKVQFTAEIESSDNASEGVKLGAAVKKAYKAGADLRGADLRGAVLRGAVLRDADLRDADLTGADLRDADLSGADLRGADLRGGLEGVPLIPDIHKAVYDAASAPEALDMGHWHSCDTTHCRAGWVVTLAGPGGKALEWAMGTPAAAAFIYMRSDPKLEKIPNFYASNEAALEDMKRLANL